MGFEFAEYFTHYAADFAFGCISFNSFQNQRNQVYMFISASSLQSSQFCSYSSVVAFCFNFGDLVSLQFAYRTVYAQQVFRRFFFLGEFVNANDDATASFDIHLPFVSRILDFFLDVALSDSFGSATEFVNLFNVFPSFFFDLVGQSFYIVGTAQRVEYAERW